MISSTDVNAYLLYIMYSDFTNISPSSSYSIGAGFLNAYVLKERLYIPSVTYSLYLACASFS